MKTSGVVPQRMLWLKSLCLNFCLCAPEAALVYAVVLVEPPWHISVDFTSIGCMAHD